MRKEARIYVAGHRGLAGSAIVRSLHTHGYRDIVVRTHAELDLTEQRTTRAFFARERPEYVFLAAAKVGGILANDTYPADFIHENLAIQTNVIHESFVHGVKGLVFLGSSCIYPRDCPQPIREDYLLTGPLEATNRAYALAKIAGLEMCSAYNRQYGTRYVCAMPTNLYGPGDNYDLKSSHVLAALLRKAHEAKAGGERRLEVWGSGSPLREFLHADDAADACIFLMNRQPDASTGELTRDLFNVGTGSDISIRELALMIMKVVGLDADLAFDATKPDGTPRKLLDVSKLSAMGWTARRRLVDGIRSTYSDFMSSRT